MTITKIKYKMKELVESSWGVYVAYTVIIVAFTAVTLKYLFKTTPKWFKEVITIFWAVVFGIVGYITIKDISIMWMCACLAFAMLGYDKILKRIIDFNYDDGKKIL